MDCQQALEAVSAALDGELSQEEQAALTAHLAQCPECRELAEDFGVLSAILDEMEQAPPPELAQAVRAAVEQDNVTPIDAGKNKRRFPFRRFAAAAALLVLCLGGAGLYYRSGFGADSADNASGAAPQDASFSLQAEEHDPSADGGYEPSAEIATAGSEGTADEPITSHDTTNGAEEPDTFYREEPAEAMPPIPSPSAAPAPPAAEGTPDTDGVPSFPFASAPLETMNGQNVSLERAFAYLGGIEAYPSAQLQKQDGQYCYVLMEDSTSQRQLVCDGLSEDGKLYLFRVLDVTETTETVITNLAVPLDGGEVLDGIQ